MNQEQVKGVLKETERTVQEAGHTREARKDASDK